MHPGHPLWLHLCMGLFHLRETPTVGVRGWSAPALHIATLTRITEQNYMKPNKRCVRNVNGC